jgi:hypothetical protein
VSHPKCFRDPANDVKGAQKQDKKITKSTRIDILLKGWGGTARVTFLF